MNPTVEVKKTIRTDDLAPFNPKLADEGEHFRNHALRRWAHKHAPDSVKAMFE